MASNWEKSDAVEEKSPGNPLPASAKGGSPDDFGSISEAGIPTGGLPLADQNIVDQVLGVTGVYEKNDSNQ